MRRDRYYAVVRNRVPAAEAWWQAAHEAYAEPAETAPMSTGVGAVLAALLGQGQVVVSAAVLQEFQAWVKGRPAVLRRSLAGSRPYVAEALPEPEPVPSVTQDEPARGGRLRGPARAR